MTIVITIQLNKKVKMDKELQLELLRIIQTINTKFKTNCTYHEHLNHVCTYECIKNTVEKMGYG